MSERPLGPAVEALEALIARLRTECPWDREQTHSSLVKYLVEESQEVVDALAALERAGSGGESGSTGEPPSAGAGFAELQEELGDLFLQILLHSRLASEEGHFSLVDVIEGLQEKLIRRHPHVFGDFVADTPEEVNANWTRIKAAERAAKNQA